MSDTIKPTTQVTLSGGNYGGKTVDWPVGDGTYTVIDEAGAKWIYTLAEGADQAVFSGMG